MSSKSTITKPKVAFIIVCWNNESLLKECFESIVNQTHKNYEIIMVDNGSEDNSVAFTRKDFPNVKIIEAKQNLGFAKGNNIGIAEALKNKDTRYVALINTDARIDPDWTQEIVKFAAYKPKGAFYQGTTLDYFDHSIIDSTHIFVARNGQGTQGNWRKRYSKELGPKKVFGVNAAACFISRKFIESQPFASQLFDERMFMYLEDVDACARATILGWDNYLVPAARAYHMGSASSGKNPGFSLYMTFRNNSALLFKNYPISLLLKMLPNLIRGDIDTIRTLQLTGKSHAIKYVIKGRLIGFMRTPLYFNKKLKINHNKKIDKKYLWQLMREGH